MPRVAAARPAAPGPGVAQFGAAAKAQTTSVGPDLSRVQTMQAARTAAAKTEAVKVEVARVAATAPAAKAGKPAQTTPARAPARPEPSKPDAAKLVAGRSEPAKPGPGKDWSATLPITNPVNFELAEVRVVKLTPPAPSSGAASRFEPRLALMVGLAGLLVLAGVESLLAPRHIDAAALSDDAPAVAPTPEPAEPPQRMAVAEGGRRRPSPPSAPRPRRRVPTPESRRRPRSFRFRRSSTPR